MRGHGRILLVAAVAGVLGIAAGLAINGPGPLLRTEWGQRVVNGAYRAVAPPAPAGLEVALPGGPVPTIALPDLDGRTLRVPDDFAGQPLLVNVWASWCGPCIAEMPELDRFATAQGPHGTRVVGIALDETVAVREFLDRVPVGYPVLLDSPGPRDAGVVLGNPRGALPYTALLDRDGTLVKVRLGPFVHGEIDDWARDVD